MSANRPFAPPLLVLALGLASAIGVLAMANRQAREALARYGAMETATSLVHERMPVGCTADAGDADGDGWRGTGAFSWGGSYAIASSGTCNGFFVVREESSQAADIVSVRCRWAQVTVEVFEGVGGRHLATIRERVLRNGGGP